jgi:hypothetical protein
MKRWSARSFSIFSAFGDAGSSHIRCNVTGWYVEPECNSYAALFALRAFQRKDGTYINISARPVARPIIKAQGFAQPRPICRASGIASDI